MAEIFRWILPEHGRLQPRVQVSRNPLRTTEPSSRIGLLMSLKFKREIRYCVLTEYSRELHRNLGKLRWFSWLKLFGAQAFIALWMPYLSVFNQEKKVIRGVNTKALSRKTLKQFILYTRLFLDGIFFFWRWYSHWRSWWAGHMCISWYP